MLRQEAGIQVDKFYPPTDWQDSNNEQIDIRKNAENNSIVLLVGHSADFSKYSLLGVLVDTSAGTYDVYIDDVLVGSAVTKNTQYDIDFSTINTSYGSATTPETLVLHKVVIKPTTSGAEIRRFQTRTTTGASNYQQQGVIWGHFELTNVINISACFAGYTKQYNINLVAITSKNNEIKANSRGIDNLFNQGADLGSRTSNYFSYLPDIYFVDSDNVLYGGIGTPGSLKRVKLVSGNRIQLGTNSFYNCANLEQLSVKTKRIDLSAFDYLNNLFYNCKKLKQIVNKKIGSNVTSSPGLLTSDSGLFPTKIDVSAAKNLTIIGVNGVSSFPMRGLRGLKVSNEAPFSGTSPQIDVSDTGLDRDALVELFNSLPTVTGSQTLKCVAATGNNLKKAGSPTIDENGVASGFSTGNYIETVRTLKITNKYELCTKIKVTDNSSANPIFRCNGGRTTLRVDANNKLQLVAYDISGTYFDKKGTTVLPLNTDYYVKFKVDNHIATVSYSLDGVNYIDEITNSMSETNETSVIFGFNSTIYLKGYMYLEETYVKVEQNYLMKGYITDTDKAIATNKGWALTLS